MRLKLPLAALALTGLLGATGCNLLKTNDGEGISGRGAKAFDPYQANVSGAIRLSLQMYNGCAIEPQGRAAGKGSLNIPYPNSGYADCKIREDQGVANWVNDPSMANPTEPIHLIADTNYFLDHLTLVNSVLNGTGSNPLTDPLNTDPTQLNAVANWFEAVPPFNKLDWSNFGITEDKWEPSSNTLNPAAFTHEVLWSNAAWQQVKNDTFTVDVIDPDGQVRASQTYDRADLLVQNQATGHTMFRWMATSLQAPQFPGDNSVRAASDIPPPPGYPPTAPPQFFSLFKIEFKTSVKPSKQLALPKGFTGPAAIRVTWSQLPNDPFYWPVTIDAASSLPSTCYSAADQTTPVPCTFGNVPSATLSPPANATADSPGFYTPGETFTVTIAAKDSAGNYLHPIDHLPSWNDYSAGNANGLMYFNFADLSPGFEDTDTVSGFTIDGPKQAMRPTYELNDVSYYRMPSDQYIPGIGNVGLNTLTDPTLVANALPGALDAPISSTYTVTMPPDAKPGTYTLFVKVNRYFYGERSTKITPIDFQVGQAEVTKFPGRVGNCQICHRGTISLDNVRHGLSVDYVEGCKACHNRDAFVAGRIGPSQNVVHLIHMSSAKFPLKKNDCSICHLTRESALRPSYLVCSGCHATPHGGRFGYLETTPDQVTSIKDTVFSDCGSACHANTPPTQHILPAQ
jgi:hypothetical protein